MWEKQPTTYDESIPRSQVVQWEDYHDYEGKALTAPEGIQTSKKENKAKNILEYSASYMLEKIFHARWWDYSTKKFNLNGRVCADTLLPFGLLGLLLVYAITPVMFSCFDLLSETMIQIICLSLSLLFLADITISTTTLVKIRVHAGKLNGDSTEKITNEVRSVLAEESALVRRMMRAFPEARIVLRVRDFHNGPWLAGYGPAFFRRGDEPPDN